MITCQVRYVIDPYQLTEFEAYAKAWLGIVERLGGTHHGSPCARPAGPVEWQHLGVCQQLPCPSLPAACPAEPCLGGDDSLLHGGSVPH